MQIYNLTLRSRLNKSVNQIKLNNILLHHIGTVILYTPYCISKTPNVKFEVNFDYDFCKNNSISYSSPLKGGFNRFNRTVVLTKTIFDQKHPKAYAKPNKRNTWIFLNYLILIKRISQNFLKLFFVSSVICIFTFHTLNFKKIYFYC